MRRRERYSLWNRARRPWTLSAHEGLTPASSYAAYSTVAWRTVQWDDFRVAKEQKSPLGRLAAAIKQRRSEVGISQEGLAFESGVSLRHLQKIEAATVDVKVLTLHELATVLETTAGRLIDGDEAARRRKG
jgi:ribosome-binding protein aMBF1 (putative translation factor)